MPLGAGELLQTSDALDFTSGALVSTNATQGMTAGSEGEEGWCCWVLWDSDN